jgi:hypothetical protein
MTDFRPEIPGAPGLVWKRRVNGWAARWQARTDLIRRGWPIKSLPLWEGTEPTPQQVAYIQDQCRRLQSEMLVWGRGGITQLLPYDGTIRGLIAAYSTDQDSRYRKVRYHTRLNYDNMLKRIERDNGKKLLIEIRARDVLAWHRTWLESGIAMSHALITMLRNLLKFGATILECEECKRLRIALDEMRFENSRQREERITVEQANAVRAKANEMGRPSIALAQAFQFDLMLRQRDVIGEWVPLNEPGMSDITVRNWKWLRGLRWSEIDGNLILRHTTSKKLKPIEFE